MRVPTTAFEAAERPGTLNNGTGEGELGWTEDALGQRQVWNTLRRRWRVSAAIFVLVLASVAAYTFTREKEYSSTAQLYFRDLGLDQKLLGTSSFVTPQTTPADASATNVGLVSVPAVSVLAAEGLHISPSIVEQDVTVSPVGQSSSLVKVVATARSPAVAARIANAVVTTFIAYRQAADRSQLATAEALVKGQLASLSARRQQNTRNFSDLQSRATQLQILSALQTGDAELLQPGTVPTSPSKPNKPEYLVFGALLGLVLATFGALLMERFDRSVRDSSEVGALLQIPILVDVPNKRGLVDAWRSDLKPADARTVQEAFRTLVARLRYFNLDRRTQVALVVSALPAEGKSTVAWHLAKAATVGGANTLLIEADLHRPVMAARHRLRPMPGLGETLPIGGPDLSEAVQRVPVSNPGPEAERSTTQELELDVLVAGLSAPNPASLLQSHRMEALLTDARARYDFVVIDTPPASVVSDVYPLVRQVDGVVVVAHAGRSQRRALVDLRRQLLRLRAPLLGAVANASATTAHGYGYGYGGPVAPQTVQTNGAARERPTT